MDVFLPLAFLALDLATPHKLAPATQIKKTAFQIHTC